MGIVARRSQSASHCGASPNPSLPNSSAVRAAGVSADSGSASSASTVATSWTPCSSRSVGQIPRQVLALDQRETEVGAHRSPRHAARERIGTVRTQQHRVDAEGGTAAHDPAQVLRVLHADARHPGCRRRRRIAPTAASPRWGAAGHRPRRRDGSGKPISSRTQPRGITSSGTSAGTNADHWSASRSSTSTDSTCRPLVTSLSASSWPSTTNRSLRRLAAGDFRSRYRASRGSSIVSMRITGMQAAPEEESADLR